MNTNEKQIFKTKVKLIADQAILLASAMIEDDAVNDLNEYDLLYACIQYLDENNRELMRDLDKQIKKEFITKMLKKDNNNERLA